MEGPKKHKLIDRRARQAPDLDRLRDRKLREMGLSSARDVRGGYLDMLADAALQGRLGCRKGAS